MTYNILIADDEPMLTSLLANHFEDCSYTALTAGSAEEAMTLRKDRPDLILLDINIPDMDGLEFCRIVRDHVSCSIVFLTARISEQGKINGFMAG